MNPQIDRLAASVATRRGTLALWSIAALMGLTRIGSASARKNGKKKDKCDRKVERAVADLCGPQVDFCLANISPICDREDDVPAC